MASRSFGRTHDVAAGVKEQLAAVRMLFAWLITGQVVPTNPASAVRGRKYAVTTGKTPVLDGSEWRRLLAAIPAETVRDPRDRALIATPTYSFARIARWKHGGQLVTHGPASRCCRAERGPVGVRGDTDTRRRACHDRYRSDST